MLKLRESGTFRPVGVIEARDEAKGKGGAIKLVLVDEGLGNRRNKNYYGPEAIRSAVTAFEGEPCHLDHPSVSEESDLPERSVRTIAGYYKGLHVERLANPESGQTVSACVGNLHFDLSEAGRNAYAKAQVALEFQKQFPKSRKQYVGWSVLGDGEAEKRIMTVEGEKMEVNYVTKFTEGTSCDMVTQAARGGRALVAVAEDARGTSRAIKQEVSMKLIESLKKTAKNIAKAIEAATDEEQKKLLAESLKAVTLQVEAIEAGYASHEQEAAAVCGQREGESEADHSKRMKAFQKASKKKASAEAEAESEAEAENAESEDGEDDSDADDDKKKHKERKGKKESLTPGELRRNALALTAAIAEAGVPEAAYSDEDMGRFARMPFEEAERLIKKDGRLLQAAGAGKEFPVALPRGGVRESAHAGDVKAAFKSSFTQEA